MNIVEFKYSLGHLALIAGSILLIKNDREISLVTEVITFVFIVPVCLFAPALLARYCVTKGNNPTLSENISTPCTSNLG